MSPTDTFITIGGLRLHLRDWGGPDVPPAMVLVHGLASNARIWDLLAPLLAPNFRLVAIDQRGHGLSDKPDDGYDLASIAGDLAGAIAALGISRPLVVGHSWGANVALQLAADHPDLPGGIVLLDGGTNELASVMPLEETLERLAPPRLAGTPRRVLGAAARPLDQRGAQPGGRAGDHGQLRDRCRGSHRPAPDLRESSEDRAAHVGAAA